MMRGKLFSTLLFVAAISAPTGAQAITLNVTSGGVGQALMCADMLCLTETLTQDDVGALSGTITIEGGNVSFNLTASVIGFSGTDGAVTDLELQSVNYVAGPVAYTGDLSHFTASGNAAVTGTVSPDSGGSSALNIPVAPFTLVCDDDAGQLKCGIPILGFPMFSIQVDGNTRYVPHTLNPTAVPEPQVSVMALTAGLLGLAYGRRKATN